LFLIDILWKFDKYQQKAHQPQHTVIYALDDTGVCCWILWVSSSVGIWQLARCRDQETCGLEGGNIARTYIISSISY
jgi:hypothetical protein